MLKPNIVVKYKILVKDKEGNVIDEREEISKSFLKNFMLLLNAIFNKTYNSVVDTSGTEVNAGAKCSYSVSSGWKNGYSVVLTGTCYGGLLVGAGEGDDSYGIIVGSGTTEVTPDDYNLANKIAHGTADGQLYYKKQVVGKGISIEGNTIKQTFSRVFRNDGSVDVTINEIGLVVNIPVDGYKVLIIRDVLSNPVVVPGGGGYVIVTYSMEVN